MGKRVWILVLCLFAVRPAAAAPPDGIDLAAAVYHGSPTVSGWPVTVTLEAVEFKAGRPQDGNTVGVRPVFDRAHMNLRWPDVKPPGWDGFIQYTIWACVRPSDRWHCAGLHEFWSDRHGSPRVWTGAPLLTQWHDWVYRSQWGPEMESYQPKVGDEVAFLLTAGDRRLMDLGDVRERTNVIRVRLVESGLAQPIGGGVTPPDPGPPPQPVPATVDVSGLQRQIDELRTHVDDLRTYAGEIRAYVEQGLAVLDQRVSSTIDRIVALEARPTVRGCRASISGVIPISCRLE